MSAPVISTHYVNVEGISTHYLEAGTPDSEVIVLIHDGTYGASGGTAFGPLIASLAADYHVFAPDMTGFGRTAKVYDFAQGVAEQRISHLAAWLDVVGVEQANFVGHCFGGGLVLTAAAEGSWPVLRGVSICGTGGFFRVPGSHVAVETFAGIKEDMARIVGTLVGDKHVASQLIDARYEEAMVRGHWGALAAAAVRPPFRTDAPRNRDYIGGLRRINIPFMLIAGGDDSMLEKGWEIQIKDAIGSNASSAVIPHGLHAPHLDFPDDALRLLTDFLRP